MSLVKSKITSLIWGLFLSFCLSDQLVLHFTTDNRFHFARYVEQGRFILIQQEDITSLMLTFVLLVTMFYRDNSKDKVVSNKYQVGTMQRMVSVTARRHQVWKPPTL